MRRGPQGIRSRSPMESPGSVASRQRKPLQSGRRMFLGKYAPSNREGASARAVALAQSYSSAGSGTPFRHHAPLPAPLEINRWTANAILSPTQHLLAFSYECKNAVAWVALVAPRTAETREEIQYDNRSRRLKSTEISTGTIRPASTEIDPCAVKVSSAPANCKDAERTCLLSIQSVNQPRPCTRFSTVSVARGCSNADSSAVTRSTAPLVGGTPVIRATTSVVSRDPSQLQKQGSNFMILRRSWEVAHGGEKRQVKRRHHEIDTVPSDHVG